ncbi:ATP-binding protein [Shewanella putrefaciens]|uniref:ATP-binding protein n=3 Tax=Shewanella putrefaciens TaxID=24 RepID=UPI0028632EA7|nr:ATP-binding protein [Shewanella putrefaciens]MDR6964767.1 signal transduction histidine kinase [Shewanella putrefaciens]
MIKDDKFIQNSESFIPSKPVPAKSKFFGKFLLKQFIRMYLALIFLFFICTAGNEMLFNSLYYEEIQDDKTRDYEAVFMLIKELYRVQASEELQILLQDINVISNIQIEIIPLEQLTLSEIQLSDIQQGISVWPYFPLDLHFRLIAPNMVVKIGPMKESEAVKFISIAFEYFPLFIFLGFALFWVLGMQYRLVKLEHAANSFSQGEFDVRAPEGALALGNLSTAFNSMAERLKRLFESQRNLINAVSHELRSPIGRLRFQLEMMACTSDKNLKNKYLLGMSADIDDMEQMVHELLSYTKLENTEPLLKLEKIDISNWLLKQRKHLITEINTEISLSLPARDSLVAMEPQLMSRLLRNLVSNADKYTRTTIVIGVSIDSLQYKLWVDDDGPGIEEEQGVHIFEPFTRLDASRNKETGGYGLGLAIVAQIARQHSGKVSVHRSEYGGARILVTWPVG